MVYGKSKVPGNIGVAKPKIEELLKTLNNE